MTHPPKIAQDEVPERLATKPFIEHLDDLRQALVRSVLCLALGVAVAIPLAPKVLMWLKSPVSRANLDPDKFLTVLSVGGGLSIAMKTILWTAVLLSAPFILWSVAWFVFPGLTRKEKRVATVAVAVAVVLFAVGVGFGYWMLPMGLQMFLAINEWLGVSCQFWDLADYVQFVLRILLAFGLTFEIPVVVLALGFLGIINSDQLRRTRRHVILALLILSMVVTPQTDPFSMLFLTVPLALLHEACIWILRVKERRAKYPTTA